MQELISIVESESFHKLLAALFLFNVCFIAVFYLLLSILRNNVDSKAMKFFGVLVISGYSLFINNWIIYVLVTIVASTFITVPRFLVQILEIMLRKQNYTLEKGGKKDKVSKTMKEVEQITVGEPGILIPNQVMESEFNSSSNQLEQLVEYTISLEEQILQAIILEKEKIGFIDIKFNQILTKPNRKEILLDAIIKQDSQTIILEVQPFIQYNLLYKSIGELKRQCSSFEKYLKSNHTLGRVKGVLCTLNTLELKEDIVGGVALLKYDLERECFANLSEVLEWLQM